MQLVTIEFGEKLHKLLVPQFFVYIYKVCISKKDAVFKPNNPVNKTIYLYNPVSNLLFHTYRDSINKPSS